MALFKYFKLDYNTSFLIWYINETEEELLDKLVLKSYESKELSKIQNHISRKYWLASRVSLQELMNREKYYYQGLYREKGYNKILGINLNFSFAFKFNYVLCCIDKEKPIGVEIEVPNIEVTKIKHKYLKFSEIDEQVLTFNNICLYISTKKAVFKAHRFKHTSILNDITLDIRPKLSGEQIRGFINYQPFISRYKFFSNFFITWCRRLFKS